MKKSKYDIMNGISTNLKLTSLKAFISSINKKKRKDIVDDFFESLLNNAHVFYEIIEDNSSYNPMHLEDGRLNKSYLRVLVFKNGFYDSYVKILLDDMLQRKYNCNFYDVRNSDINKKYEMIEELQEQISQLSEEERELIDIICNPNFKYSDLNENQKQELDEYHNKFMNEKVLPYVNDDDTEVSEKQIQSMLKKLSDHIIYHPLFEYVIKKEDYKSLTKNNNINN